MYIHIWFCMPIYAHKSILKYNHNHIYIILHDKKCSDLLQSTWPTWPSCGRVCIPMHCIEKDKSQGAHGQITRPADQPGVSENGGVGFNPQFQATLRNKLWLTSWFKTNRVHSNGIQPHVIIPSSFSSPALERYLIGNPQAWYSPQEGLASGSPMEPQLFWTPTEMLNLRCPADGHRQKKSAWELTALCRMFVGRCWTPTQQNMFHHRFGMLNGWMVPAQLHLITPPCRMSYLKKARLISSYQIGWTMQAFRRCCCCFNVHTQIYIYIQYT